MNSSKTDALSREEVEELLHKDILSLLGLKDIDEKQKKEFEENVLTSIENRTWNRVKEMLKEKGKLEEYDKAEDIDKFLEENGVNVEKIYIEEAIFYKLQLKSYAKAIDETLIQPATQDKK